MDLSATWRGAEADDTLRRAYTGDVLLGESEHDTVIPHKVVFNYRDACIRARSLTYRMNERADHALSTESIQAAYKALIDLRAAS